MKTIWSSTLTSITCSIVLFFLSSPAHALWSLSPRVAVGYNPAQGTYYSLGADLYSQFTDSLDIGFSGYYAAGEHPQHDREYGVGPFVAYRYPLLDFLTLHLREDVSYIDMNIPIHQAATDTYTHVNETGIASITSFGVHMALLRNFGISAGYRLVIGITNDEIDDDRSGLYAGLTIGI